MKEKTIFDYLNNLYYKSRLEYDPKIAPAYLISLWLSHDKSLLPIVNKINPYHFLLDDRIIYSYYYDMIPKGKRYIKWIKKEKKEGKFENLHKEMGISKMELSRYRDIIKML